MGTSAGIMILINILSWPSNLLEMRKKKELSKLKLHKRAVSLLNQLDEVVEFCSGLMNQIKDLGKQIDEELALYKTEDEIEN